jgi:hypothetical protein
METGMDLIFKAPLTEINREKIHFYQLGEDGKPVAELPFSIAGDTSNLCRYVFNTDKWDTGVSYNVEFLAGAFSDIYKLQNDSVAKRIQTPNTDKFSIIIVESKNVQCNYILQLLNGKKVVQTKQINKDGSVKISFVEPGTYTLKIIEDKNNNGRWDTGSLRERRQPERVKLYRLDDGQTAIKMRQGWENTIQIDMKKFWEDNSHYY